MLSRLIQYFQPYSRFLFISSVFCFKLPSDSTSRWTPLSSTSNSDYYGSQWTFTNKLTPMPSALKTKRAFTIVNALFVELLIFKSN
ncbi:hypothetical protein FHL06_10975 [Lactobacillus halodurans]|uniref:Uncharacterized protein n=1 Tax=Companilactobacillus halodurans TaxID=2584183 RepID=A0A5P0ZYQ9_9LACO|nr:hypothetical protein [Companilactobacillus halodurans]MQS98097.1 hypothetical protein [Companilactobacillus halodurans]